MQSYLLVWTPFPSFNNPITGLFNYGMEVTSSGALVIYGGVTEDNPSCLAYNRNLSRHNDLWLLNLNETGSDFSLVKWIDSPGGYSKIVSLGGETLCILNPSFESQMIIIDLEEMISYKVMADGMPEQLKRTAFGIAGSNGRDFIIYGGYNEYDGLVKDISQFDLLVQISFSIGDVPDALNYGTIVGGVVSGILVIVSLFLLYYRIGKRKKIPISTATSLNYLTESSEALENSRKYFENRILNIADDPEFTATLALPNHTSLCIPAYKLAAFGIDFRTETIIGSGGFGEVHKGLILNPEFSTKYNAGDQDCVVKISKRQINSNHFLQEMSIHEIFQDIKYFSQLVCFSEDPETIVLKYYKFGDLHHYIFNQNEKRMIEYSVENAIPLAKRIAWSLDVMHKKGYIHDDIKRDP
jgi:hypothetical protein